MAALTADKSTALRDGRIIRGRVGASTTIFKGALLEIAAGGTVSPATKAANKTYWGIAREAIATGAGETGVIEAEHGATVHFAGNATLDTGAEKLAALGDKAYVLDDQTVTTASDAATACGVIVDYDEDGVWVRLDN